MNTSRASCRTLVLGSCSLATELVREILARTDSGYDLLGVVAADPEGGQPACGIPVLGTVAMLQQIIAQQHPAVIIVAVAHDNAACFDHLLLEACMGGHIRIEQAHAVYERLTGKLPIEALAPGALIYSSQFTPGRPAMLANRLLSVACALPVVVLLAPLLLVLAALIKLDSEGTVLFSQQRTGFRGKPFCLYKFRSMRAATATASEWEGDNVHRITRIGRWMRKYRLDELPQFFNILTGDMNLVGPRPHPAASMELFELVSRNTPECGMPIPWYSLRHGVIPGITGWAQVRYRYANNMEEEIEKLRFDLYYIKHYGFWLDLRILLETVRTVLAGKGTAAVTPAPRVPANSLQAGYART